MAADEVTYEELQAAYTEGANYVITHSRWPNNTTLINAAGLQAVYNLGKRANDGR